MEQEATFCFCIIFWAWAQTSKSYDVVTFFVPSYRLLGTVQLLSLKTEAACIINLAKREYRMCLTLRSDRVGDVYSSPLQLHML